MNVQLQPRPYRIMLPAHRRRGMGDDSEGPTPVQQGQLITAGGQAAVQASRATGTAGQIGAGVTAAFDIAAAFSGPAAPIVAAIGNVLGPLIATFNGCGQTCVIATQDVNQVGTAMSQAFQIYMSAPIHYLSAQQVFLSQFDQLMAALQQACSNPQLGSAGQACISDNSPNACKWKAAPGGWSQNSDGTWKYTYWGAAGSGTSCWNPYTGIRDMVAQDPTVVPDGTAVSGGSTTVGTNSTTFAAPVPVTQAASLSLPNLSSLIPSSTEGWLLLGGLALALVLIL